MNILILPFGGFYLFNQYLVLLFKIIFLFVYAFNKGFFTQILCIITFGVTNLYMKAYFQEAFVLLLSSFSVNKIELSRKKVHQLLI